MKKWIYGRRQGSAEEYALLVESTEIMDLGTTQSIEMIQKQYAFELRNLYRNVDMFRERGVEGYVLLEGDTTHYIFSPHEKFTVPEKVKH